MVFTNQPGEYDPGFFLILETYKSKFSNQEQTPDIRPGEQASAQGYPGQKSRRNGGG